MTVSVLEAHPHAAAVLGAALRDRPSHAYLFHGPAGSGKREAAREFAAELLSRDAPDPENARARALAGAHPDLTWVAPSGAHIMLRGDVDQSVVAAASHTPFESAWRVFVLERADTMDDPAANTLLKTLEEPPSYVVLILLTDRPTQVLPTITSRCQGVRFDAPPPGRLAERLEARGVEPHTARACARLSLGDGERALALALGDGPALRARAEAFARAALDGAVGKVKPWTEVLAAARAAGDAAQAELEQALASELEYLPKKEHRRKQTEFTERARRAARRAETGALDHALQLVGLWFRDLACIAADAEELVLASDRLEALRAGARDAHALHAALELVEDTRARLPFNVSYDLALQALAYRLERTLVAPIPA
jgi:DNA polymerase III subunit delta'